MMWKIGTYFLKYPRFSYFFVGLALSFALSFSMSGTASADTICEQAGTQNGDDFWASGMAVSGINIVTDYGTFTASTNETVNAVNVALSKVAGTTDDFLIHLEADTSGNPSGVVLATAVYHNADIPDDTFGSDFQGFTPITSPLSAPVALIGGHVYHIVTDRTGTLDATHFFTIETKSGYASGTFNFSYTTTPDWLNPQSENWVGYLTCAVTGFTFVSSENVAATGATLGSFTTHGVESVWPLALLSVSLYLAFYVLMRLMELFTRVAFDERKRR